MGKRSFNLLLILIFLFVPALLFSQVDTAWVRRYNGPGDDDDRAYALVVDPYGNVYVTGGSYDFGTSFDYATLKYDSNGNLLWVRRYNGTGDSTDAATAIAVDADGNVYVTGGSYGSGTSFDYATLKYDRDGNLLWERRYDGTANDNDVATAIAVDADGNVYVTGRSYLSGNDYDYVILKYDSNGNLLWERRYNGTGDSTDMATAIAVDADGNVYVTGYSFGSGTYFDYVTLKYDRDGNLSWERRYNGTGSYHDWAYALVVDPYGNVYVTGGSYASGAYFDYVTLKYDANGNLLWERRYNGPASYWDEGYALVVDAYGNVYVTGGSYGSGTSFDYVTLKYDRDGNLLWERRYNGPVNDSDWAYDLAVDAYGNVYVTGSSQSGYVTYYDYATLKYDRNGNLLWERRYNGPGNFWDVAYAIAVDGNGNIYVTGYSYHFITYDDYATIKYVQEPGISEEKIDKIENRPGKKIDKIYDITGKIVKEKLKKGVYFKITEKGKGKILILK